MAEPAPELLSTSSEVQETWIIYSDPRDNERARAKGRIPWPDEQIIVVAASALTDSEAEKNEFIDKWMEEKALHHDNKQRADEQLKRYGELSNTASRLASRAEDAEASRNTLQAENDRLREGNRGTAHYVSVLPTTRHLHRRREQARRAPALPRQARRRRARVSRRRKIGREERE